MKSVRWTRKLAQSIIVGAAGLTCGAAQAANYLDGMGREWLDMTQVLGYSWNQINAVCQSDTEAAGPCAGQVGGTGYDLSGWTWANRAEVVGLIQTFMVANGDNTGSGSILSQNGYGTNSFGWATALITSMGQTGSFGGDMRTIGFMNGLDTLGFNTTAQQAFICAGASGCGWQSFVGAGVSAGVGQTVLNGNYGGWYYRAAAPVPEPASLLMMLAGVAAVSSAMARRKAASAG